jgi:glycosyltransferase involved in cell wall biosynthesis
MGVSIIIPAYNAEKTITECLAAIQNLDWDGEIEVILVNDGSTDNTAEIASSFPEVQVINIFPNGGVHRATNIGIEAAHYGVVVSVDSDAILETDWLRRNPGQQHHLAEKLSLRGHEVRVVDYEILWRTQEKREFYCKREVFSKVSKIYDGVGVTVIHPGIVKLPCLEYVSLVLSHGREIKR